MTKLTVKVIMEVMGRPPENVTDALMKLVEKIEAEEGVVITDKIINEPKPVKDSKDLYTAFADLTLELDSLTNYFGLLFGYMPSHIELITPEKIQLSNFELNDLANQIASRLHNYDAIAKRIIVEKDILLKKLQEVAPHLFKKKEQAANVTFSTSPKSIKKKAKKKKAKKTKAN